MLQCSHKFNNAFRSIWPMVSRHVATWSPLGSAFNSRPEEKLSVKFTRGNQGLFKIPEVRDHTGFYLLQENVRAETDRLVSEITDPRRLRKLVEIFDELSDCLCRVADMADFVRVAHPDQRYSEAARETCQSVSTLVEQLNTNVAIHDALKAVIVNESDVVALDDIDRRVAEMFMFDFEQSGIDLPDKERKEFVALNEHILSLGATFVQNCQHPSAIDRERLPEHLRHVFSVDGSKVLVTGLFSDHHNNLVREAAYKIYLHPDRHQSDILQLLLSYRKRLANLVGFPTYAKRALRGTLGDNPANVMNFLNALSEEVRPWAREDFKELSEMKRHSGSEQPLMPWDTAYYAGLARHDRCKVSHVDIAPYLSLGACMEGLNNLFHSLYGITLRYEELLPGEVWSSDVHKLAVFCEQEGLLGHIYCDFLERADKLHQDCHFTIQGGRLLSNGTYQNPIVVLMLNFPPPRGHVPSLLSPGMLENLFHEFGHAIHSMLGRTKYQHVTGTRCPTDFAEVPSILMEYFVTNEKVLSTFARHWQTSEPLSPEKISSLCNSKRMFAASDLQLQVFYSVLDQVYHRDLESNFDTTQMLSQVQTQYYSLPYVPSTAWHLRFSHFVGYGAKYYSYLMSRAVASRIWHQYFKQDPFSRTMGEKLRKNMLMHGGNKHPSELVEAMFDEKFSTSKLVQSLMDDLRST